MIYRASLYFMVGMGIAGVIVVVLALSWEVAK